MQENEKVVRPDYLKNHTAASVSNIATLSGFQKTHMTYAIKILITRICDSMRRNDFYSQLVQS